MAFDCKIKKEKHYKKSRFSTDNEKDLNQFKKDNIVEDIDELQTKAIEHIKMNTAIWTNKNNFEIPKNGGMLAIRTQAQINTFSIFLKFIKEFGRIDFLSLQSYTIDKKTVIAMDRLLKENKIGKLQIIMTETASFRIPKIYKMLKDLFAENPRVNLCFYWVHSKVHMLKCGDKYFVVDGSGNFSMNAQIEQYNIFNSKELYDFDYKICKDYFFGEKKRNKHEIFQNFKL